MELEGCHSNPKLPGWSKTGRRTRGARAHHQWPTTSDDELAAENLPPKKRKLDSGERNGKDLCCKMPLPAKHHRCNICSRSFSSYQALGGHKAHHNTKEHHKATTTDSGIGTLDDAVVATVHRCTLCYKVFAKGQALGGHRRHCQGGAKMFTFDLNELPPECLASSMTLQKVTTDSTLHLL